MEILENLPGVQILELPLDAPPISGVSTSIAAFVGEAPRKARQELVPIRFTSYDQFRATFIDEIKAVGTTPADPAATAHTALSQAVRGFFANGGNICWVVNAGGETKAKIETALEKLTRIDEISMVAAPIKTPDKDISNVLIDHATKLGDRVALIDSPAQVTKPDEPFSAADRPTDSKYAACYYPRLKVTKQFKKNPEDPDETDSVTAVGHAAGVYARVSQLRGVHKAPASERIFGVVGVEHVLTDKEQNGFNKEGINALRVFDGGVVIWGARTFLAKNAAADPFFRYVSTRRLVTYVEQSLKLGLRLFVFEPNNLALQKTIERSVRGFLDRVWRDGALFGETPSQAYYVRFPADLNTDADRAEGRLTLEVGLRCTFPAEFIIVRIGVILRDPSEA